MIQRWVNVWHDGVWVYWSIYLWQLLAPFSHGGMVRCSSMRFDWMRWMRLKKSSSGTVGAGTAMGRVLRWSSIRAPCNVDIIRIVGGGGGNKCFNPKITLTIRTGFYFPIKIKVLHSVLSPQPLDSITAFYTHSALSPLPGEHARKSLFYRCAHANSTRKAFASYPYQVPIYTLGSRETMWIKCFAEGQKCRAMVGIETRPSGWELSVHTNIPRYLHQF